MIGQPQLTARCGHRTTSKDSLLPGEDITTILAAFVFPFRDVTHSFKNWLQELSDVVHVALRFMPRLNNPPV